MRVLFIKKRALWTALAAGLMLAGAAVCAALAGGEARAALAPEESLLLTRAAVAERSVAITFDTGLGSDRTPFILEALRARGAKATFAVMGLWAQRHPQLLREIVADGHEVISHSMTHECYVGLPAREIAADARTAAALLREQTGRESMLIRPPYARLDAASSAALTEAGFVPVGYSLDSGDWKTDDAAQVRDAVLAAVRPGDIVRFGTDCAATPQALGEVLDGLAQLGYSCRTVSGLLEEEAAAQEGQEHVR